MDSLGEGGVWGKVDSRGGLRGSVGGENRVLLIMICSKKEK